MMSAVLRFQETVARTAPVLALLAPLAAADLFFADSLSAQDSEVVFFEEPEEYATVVSRVGDAAVLLFEGPEIRGSGSSDEGRAGPLRVQWYFVQDSSLGVVFTEPAGVKWTEGDLDGDIDFVALEPVRAVEFKVLTFDIWRQFNGNLRTVAWGELLPGETGDWPDPRKRDQR